MRRTTPGMDSWRRRAACRGVGTHIFFPGQGSSNERALEMCRSCPVTAECLDYAVSLGPALRDGVWGGMSEMMLRGERRRRGIVGKRGRRPNEP